MGQSPIRVLLSDTVYVRQASLNRREAHVVTGCELRAAAVHLSGTFIHSPRGSCFISLGRFLIRVLLGDIVYVHKARSHRRVTRLCDKARHHRRAFSLAARLAFRFVGSVSHLGLLGNIVYVRKALSHRHKTRLCLDACHSRWAFGTIVDSATDISFLGRFLTRFARRHSVIQCGLFLINVSGFRASGQQFTLSVEALQVTHKHTLLLLFGTSVHSFITSQHRLDLVRSHDICWSTRA